jgi:hypothetical protein
VDTQLHKVRCKVDRAALVAALEASASARHVENRPLGYHQERGGGAASLRQPAEGAAPGSLLIERWCSFGNATLGVPIPVMPVSYFPELERVLASSYVVYEEAAKALARR